MRLAGRCREADETEMPLTWRQIGVRLGLALFISLLLTALSVEFGAGDAGWASLFASDKFAGHGTDADKSGIIFWKLRLPRVALGWAAGACLALAGAAIQTLLRNPLATPYTLGVASGAALGAGAAVVLGWPAFFGVGSTELSALVGAALTTILIYGIAQVGQRGGGAMRDIGSSLLLAGIVMGTIAAAGIMLLRYVAEPNRLVAVDRWLMGSLATFGWRPVLILAGLALPAILYILYAAPSLEGLAAGHDLAASRGIHPARLQLLVFAASALIVAAVVSQAGPIAFVGLIVPHFCRFVVGRDARLLLPGAFLIGGGFLAICDALARTVAPPMELPVGILTALLGGPFFLFVLIQGKRRNFL